jgi:HPr Serine kinase C-terminal domain
LIVPKPLLRYSGHGLIIESEFELALQPHAGHPDHADLVFRWAAEREVPDGPAEGELLARFEDAAGCPRLLITRGPAQTSIRFPGLCEFVGDRELRDIAVHLHPGVSPGFVGIMAAGAVITAHLVLAGTYVMHASAIQVGDAAVAFVGSSGMGKSTVAAMLTARGYALVTDDVLRVDSSRHAGRSKRTSVFAGGVENRLRLKSRSLASVSGAAEAVETADGRLSARPETTTASTLPLLACVIPMPDRVHDVVAVRRLNLADGLIRLIRYPRIVGWMHPPILSQELWAAGAVAADVPIFEAQIPWGPPFRPDIAESLMDQLAASGALAAGVAGQAIRV